MAVVIALRRLLAMVALVATATLAAAEDPPPLRNLAEAVRTMPGEAPRRVSLPDKVQAPVGDNTTVLHPAYRLEADLGRAPTQIAIYLPGVFAHARIDVNGHTVVDRIRDPLLPPPRGADNLLFVAVPAEFLRTGPNAFDVVLAGVHETSVSRVWVGDADVLRHLHDRKLFLTVESTAAAAAVILALSLCVLVLWARRPSETLYAFFGFGGLLWSLHTVWTVLPDPILRNQHFEIWWTMGYPFFIAPLVTFCVRLAGWRLPRFERAMWLGVAVGPLVLYASYRAGMLQAGKDYWRLAWIGAVAIGLVAVARYAAQQRNVQGHLLLFTGATALAFGLYDWLLNRMPGDNHPVFLSNFSGLLFFPLVAWILIDRFVQATGELERLNAELEGRVAQKSSELLVALDHMRAARDAAEAANRAKSAFLAAASHDLRQPAHALGLYVAALRGAGLPAPHGETIERMAASVGALDAMFNALLDISRMDAGAVIPDLQPVELEPLLHRIAADHARQAADKGLRLTVRVSVAAQQLRAWSDPVLLERIVRNLVENAIKYTSSGGVLLGGRLVGASAPAWRIEVWDTGPGIAAAHRERIFDEFFQADPARGTRAGGLGLGLSIVHRLGRLLQHPLQLDSVVGRGSRFAVIVPVTANLARRGEVGQPHGSLSGLGVGVLDDDPQVCDAMCALLERWGCRVIAGSSVEAVLAAAAEHATERLQVLVVDLEIPGSDGGVEAIGLLRQAGSGHQPALIVTGSSSPERLAVLRSSGFDWLIKPVPPARLRSWLVEAARAVQVRRST